MPSFKETVAAFSRGDEAAVVALRNALRFKTRRGSLIVQDALGRGATLLSPQDKGAMERRRVVWVDLADRRRPVSLFHLSRSGHFRTTWRSVLQAIRAISAAPVSDGAIDWTVDAAWALSADGSVGLASLFRSIASPEIRRWFLDTANEPSELARVLDMLSWALSFPAVYNLSEGANRGVLLDAIARPSVIWLESTAEHFEPKEHLLVQVLLEAALHDALHTMSADPATWGEALGGLTLLHLYPVPLVATTLPDWVSGHLGVARHIGVHHLEPERPLPPVALTWAMQSEFTWVAGRPGEFREGVHSAWLSPDEIIRLSGQETSSPDKASPDKASSGKNVQNNAGLDTNDLWVRSNATGQAVVTRVQTDAGGSGPAAFFRSRAARKRLPAQTDQVAAAMRALTAPAEAHRGLYARLCEVETLRTGWLRVRDSRSKSGGVDGVTISTFSDVCEQELIALADSLRAGRYRSRPLRRIQIPKPDGGVRNLGVACIRDRVVQTACLTILEPIFELGFSRFSFAFRHGRSAHQAVAVARARLADGLAWVVISDIRKCFDFIDHQTLLGLLARKIADDDLLALIRHWLATEVLEFRDLLPIDSGVPQGESISPLLANIYLDPMDKHFERLGVSFVRYADDIVLFAISEEAAQTAFGQLRDFLREALHLELKPTKTAWVRATDGFDFLGFRIVGPSILVKEERAQGLLELATAMIRDLGMMECEVRGATDCLRRLNSVLRGWRNYFLLPREPSLLAQLQGLDAALERAATCYLPASMRDALPWKNRERLSETGEEKQAPSVRGGYPEPVGHQDESLALPAPAPVVPPVRKAAPSESPLARAAPICLETKDGERLYVVTHGTWVGLSGEDLILRKQRREVFRRPLEKLGLIYLQGFGISMSVDAQVILAQRNVPVVLAPPVGSPAAVVSPVESSRASLRRLQAARRDEPNVINAGLRMLAAKISNQAAVLKYFAKYRKVGEPEMAASMSESARKMVILAKDVIGLNPRDAGVRAAAMGLEGHAASLYWQRLSTLLPPNLAFQGRVTRSAPDAVNQCLNYVYGLLYGEVWRAIVMSGLDPYFGLMHGSTRDQGSLVFDLIEEFRAPFADRIVLGMLGRGFRPVIGKHGFLRTLSRRKLVQGFMSRWT